MSLNIDSSLTKYAQNDSLENQEPFSTDIASKVDTAFKVVILTLVIAMVALVALAAAYNNRAPQMPRRREEEEIKEKEEGLIAPSSLPQSKLKARETIKILAKPIRLNEREKQTISKIETAINQALHKSVNFGKIPHTLTNESYATICEYVNTKFSNIRISYSCNSDFSHSESGSFKWRSTDS